MKRGGSRLSGGRFGGRRLRALPGVRPTEGRVREALANICLPRLEGARLLDLFAGTGAVGLELLGRGAKSVLLVDRSPAVIAGLRTNVKELGAEQARVRRLDLPSGVKRLSPATFDLIFADPPYAFDGYGKLLDEAAAVAPDGAWMVVEHAGDRELEGGESWRLFDRRRYGDSCLSFFQRASDLGSTT